MSRKVLPMKPMLLTLPLVLAGCSGPPAEPVFSGYAEAELVYLAPSAAGTLQALDVRRGDRVTRGQRLYLLDTESEVISRNAAQAREERAQAQAENLRKGKRPLELSALDQQLAQAQAALSASSSALERSRKLVAQGFIAAQQLDELVAAHDRDAARLRELQAQRALAVQSARSDEVAAAAADARGAQADTALARWRESQKARSAPTEALVYDVMYRVGEWVPAGSPVVALQPPGAVKLRFFIPQAELSQATIGRDVAVSCDGCATGLTARVRYVSPQAEFTPPVIYSNSSRSKLVFMVEAEPRDAGAAALKPGQPLDVRWKAAS